MSQQNDGLVNDETNEGGADKAQQELQMQALLTQSKNAAKAEFIAEMMKDPEYAALARARAAGKKVTISEDAGAGNGHQLPAELTQEPVDFEGMDNKGLVAYMIKTIGGTLSKHVEDKFEEFGQKLGPIEGFVRQTAVAGQKQEIGKLRTEYPDFDSYGQQMLELNAAHPTLNATQLYYMAKAQAGEPVFKGRSLQSERPSTIGARPPTHQNRKTPVPPTMAGLRELLRESATRSVTANQNSFAETDED